MFIGTPCNFRWDFNVKLGYPVPSDEIFMFIGTPFTFLWDFNVYWDTLHLQVGF